MQVQDVKIKIMHEVFSFYLAKITPCVTLQDMVQPSKMMMEQLSSLVMPGIQVHFSDVKDMPQDQMIEEYKEEVPLDE
jgi:hypothetical protein